MAKFNFVKAMDNADYVSGATLQDGIEMFFSAEEDDVLTGPSESSFKGFKMTLKEITDRESSFIGAKNIWWKNMVIHHQDEFVKKANEYLKRCGQSLLQITAAGIDVHARPWLEFAPVKVTEKIDFSKPIDYSNHDYDPDAKIPKMI